LDLAKKAKRWDEKQMSQLKAQKVTSFISIYIEIKIYFIFVIGKINGRTERIFEKITQRIRIEYS